MNKNTRLIILDDDPTGIQTVHGCLLITDWTEEQITAAFKDDQPFFYILTNTRAMTRQQTREVISSVMETVIQVNRSFGYNLIFISRSDSCLRGHFPLETDIMRETLLNNDIPVWKKVPFCPALIEAGRVTINGIHYMKDGDHLIPISETEFAHDNVFAYHTSNLHDYIIEKGGQPEDYQIVNAATYEELYAFCQLLDEETASFKGAVVIRSSSSLPKAMSGISDKPLLDRSILTDHQQQVGCFVVGSHVKKTTQQLQHLLEEPGICGMELPVTAILENGEQLKNDTLNTLTMVAEQGLTPVIYTSRTELRVDDADRRQLMGQQISDFLVDLVRCLPYTPAYLVAKGGITSNDILTKGLSVKSARVLGQIIANVPCIMTAHFPYIIFPGNVGNEYSLQEVYRKLR